MRRSSFSSRRASWTGAAGAGFELFDANSEHPGAVDDVTSPPTASARGTKGHRPMSRHRNTSAKERPPVDFGHGQTEPARNRRGDVDEAHAGDWAFRDAGSDDEQRSLHGGTLGVVPMGRRDRSGRFERS